MKPITVLKCACCGVRGDTMPWDDDLQSHVCPLCKQGLKKAEEVLRLAGIPPIHYGPFVGTSVG